VFAYPRGNVSFISIYLPLSAFLPLLFFFPNLFKLLRVFLHVFRLYFVLGFFHLFVFLITVLFVLKFSTSSMVQVRENVRMCMWSFVSPVRRRLHRGTNISLHTLRSQNNYPERGTCLPACLPVWQSHSNDGCHTRQHVPLRSFCHPRYRDTPTDCTLQFKVHFRPIV